MKVRLNKETLSQMPQAVRTLVTGWKQQYRKSFISVETVQQFYAPEDSKVTVINLISDDSKTVRAAGEFAGYTKLSPCAAIPLPEGCVAVITGFFLGHPYLELKQGGKAQLSNQQEVA